MPISLIKYALGFGERSPHFPRALQSPLATKKNYDVVIIGAGGHGLACAYYLAKNYAKSHGVKKIAVIDKAYLGGGNTARNTTIIRANYLTEEGTAFYKESQKLFAQLSAELNMNMMYSPRGHLTLAHTDAAMRTARWRAEVNKHLGVDSAAIEQSELARICPQLNLSEETRYPILGALYHPPGAIARHDAVAWGYARAAHRMGVEIHQNTEAKNILVKNNRAQAVVTTRGTLRANKIVQAVAGYSSLLASKVGLRLPIRTVPLQACVSQPLQPFLDKIVVSGSLHVYISQSARGEFVMGGATDPYELYNTRSSLEFKEQLMMHILELFPQLSEVNLLRQWAGLADLTPDFSPVMGKTELKNFYIDAGWGTWGFKATPVCGKRMAECVATDRTPKLLEPFALQRFENFKLVGEKGAASVGH